MLVYAFKTIFIQFIFLLFYECSLKKSTFFNWNRGYLLISIVLSLVLPLIVIELPSQVSSPTYSVLLPEVLLGTFDSAAQNTVEEIQKIIPITQKSWSYGWLIYILFGFVFLTMTLHKLWRIFKMKIIHPKEKNGRVLVVRTQNNESPFSFLNIIFINENVSNSAYQTILKHELVHVNQKHSYYLIFLSLLQIVFWFNPLIYLYKNRLILTHEFIADRNSTETVEVKNYINQLLNQAFKTQNIKFINSFYHPSQIKNRIKMLQNSPTKKHHLLKYLCIIPIVVGSLYFTSTTLNAQEKSASQIENQQELSEDELVKKYYNELVKLGSIEKAMESYGMIYKEISENYKKSLSTFCKIKANFLYINDETKKRKMKQGTWTEEDEERQLKRMNLSTTYEEYIEITKTLTSKLNWESRTENGILKLVVDDIDNFNEEEQKRFDKKMKMIENDEFFTGLIICQTDGKAITKIGEEKKIIYYKF